MRKTGFWGRLQNFFSRPAKLPAARDADFEHRRELKRQQKAKSKEESYQEAVKATLARLPQPCKPGTLIGELPVNSRGWMQPSGMKVDEEGGCFLDLRASLFPIDSPVHRIYVEHKRNGFHVWLDKSNHYHARNWGYQWTRQPLPDSGFAPVKKLHRGNIPSSYHAYYFHKNLLA